MIAFRGDAAKIGAALDAATENARADLLAFMRLNWWMPQEFRIGRHTRAICARLTRAIEDWRAGKSTYLMVSVPFRHGKSDIVSRALPAFFLGRCADMEPDVIMSGYGASLVESFSRRTQKIMSSPEYQLTFPGVRLARGNSRVSGWSVDGSAGTVTVAGLGGALTGKGGHLLIVDDYAKNRAESISATYRNKTWDSFRNDLLTRQNAPAAIVIVCATPWHVDDLRGRIRKSMKEDAEFPHFEELSFPARKPGEWENLFPEMYAPEWYASQRAALGKQAAALLDCEPVVEGGGRFDPWRVVVHPTREGWPTLREVRGWDLASSEKERDKDNPDRTWGIRGAVKTVPLTDGAKLREIWISSMVAVRAEAPERDRLIRKTILADGPGVPQHIEAFAGYKDAYSTMKTIARGISIVLPSRMPGDKSAKAAPMEPSFDAGLVHVFAPGCAQWLDEWRAEFAAFPDSEHDDAVDATSIMFSAASSSNVGVV